LLSLNTRSNASEEPEAGPADPELAEAT